MAENILNKWKTSLERTRKTTFGQIAALLGASEINEAHWEELEALLIQADLGVDTSEALMKVLWERERSQGLTKLSEFRSVLREEMLKLLTPPPPLDFDHRPTIILVVGVNGSGKTTTIAKLGKAFADQGKQVILGAADTFRAAAVDQLQVWGERLGLPVIAGQPGGDPGAVAYDTVQAALARNADLAMIDTAGRLHTRFNLMEELKKVYRVCGKALAGAPHAVWLVMDATTGQNALQQARAFKEAVKVNGVILAKLDSSARGGMAFAIQHELDLPILFAGLGEKPEDIQPFSTEAFVEGILADF
jgi:fused signal recognition particle receptor